MLLWSWHETEEWGNNCINAFCKYFLFKTIDGRGWPVAFWFIKGIQRCLHGCGWLFFNIANYMCQVLQDASCVHSLTNQSPILWYKHPNGRRLKCLSRRTIKFYSNFASRILLIPRHILHRHKAVNIGVNSKANIVSFCRTQITLGEV